MIINEVKRQEPIRDRSFRFAVDIVKFCTFLRELKHFELANQLIKSGTSIGANLREAFNGFSKKDYLYKISIAQKEADETVYWLEIIGEILVENREQKRLLNESNQLLKIIRTMSLNAQQKETQ